MAVYRRVLAILYFIGFLLHLTDVFDLRLSFSNMDSLWKIWIIFLLVAYVGFKRIFGDQNDLVLFHIVTLLIYFGLRGLKALKVETKG